MEIKHVCFDCGAILAVHEHASYQELKTCLTGVKPLCRECANWPGSPLPSEEIRGQEGKHSQRDS
jgi:hypothetical protein